MGVVQISLGYNVIVEYLCIMTRLLALTETMGVARPNDKYSLVLVKTNGEKLRLYPQCIKGSLRYYEELYNDLYNAMRLSPIFFEEFHERNFTLDDIGEVGEAG